MRLRAGPGIQLSSKKLLISFQCGAEFILGSMKIYLYCLSFLKTELAQGVEILPDVRQ